MAVQVWIGDKPEHPNERRAIVALANGLERLEGLYLLLANFNVGGRTIDLAVIKQDAIFIIELKHCDGKIFGGVNGSWYVESANHERKRLNPGRKNPYNQVISYYYSLVNFLKDHSAQILSDHKATQVNFRSCRRVVVIAPTIQPGSEIELDWKVELKGLDELPAFLVTERSAEISLTEEEMLRIPHMLGCSRWKDIKELIVGVLPSWNPNNQPASEPAHDGPDSTSTAIEAPPVLPPPEPAAASRPGQIWAALQTTTGRLALGMGALACILLALLLWSEGGSIPPPPSTSGQFLPQSGPPAGGVFPESMQLNDPGCIWSGFQSVGKRWDEQSRRWISVGVGGTVMELTPDVVVTLERVDYCDGQITLTWSIRNTTSQTMTFPLQQKNITIRDPIGNEYRIDDTMSEPAVIYVEPSSRAQGIAVVPRPVSQNAPSLLVRLKDEPFGEASWLVSLEGN